MMGLNLSMDDYEISTFISNPQEQKEINDLICEYGNKINTPTQNDVEAIIEQYSILKARKIDARTWISRIICEVSKKDESKQYIGYIIGIIRNRMTYGWGTSRSDEEILIIKAIEKLIGKELALKTKAQIYKLMGDYGGTKIAFALNEVNIEDLFLKSLEEELKDQEDSINL